MPAKRHDFSVIDSPPLDFACCKGLSEIGPKRVRRLQADIQADHPLRHAKADCVVWPTGLNPRDPGGTNEALVATPAHPELEELEGVAEGRDVDRRVELDLAEGADMVMVKPALSYLDIIRRVADTVRVPVAAYQVSGEFAMVEAAAANGWVDRDKAIMETLTSIRRAGASVIMTYWATEVARRLS